MLTEQEAKDKWCPQVRFEDTESNSQPANAWTIYSSVIHEVEQYGTERNPKMCRCIASECMMWRWRISPQSANEINASGNAGAIAQGYCGLSGEAR